MINFSIYFTNHLNERIKLDDNIIARGSVLTQVNKLYSSFVFTTNSIYYDTSIIGDLTNRIQVRYLIDAEKSLYFMLDNIEYLDNNNIRVYCKSLGIQYSYKYSGRLDTIASATTVSGLITSLIPTANISFTDCNFDFDYTINNKSVEEVIQDLSKIFGFEYYTKNNIIYFEDKKTIQDETPLKSFNDVEDVISLSTTTNNDTQKIRQVDINIKITEDIFSEPKLNLQIKNTPQCCSPNAIEIYTASDGTVYRINPVNAYWILYYSPLIEVPKCNILYNSGTREVIEHFDLKDDDFVVLVGGIDSIVAISGVTNSNYVQNYNVVAFDNVSSGTLDITYNTQVLHGTIAHSEQPKEIDFNIKHFNQELIYKHKIELSGYYPLPYNLEINLMKNWGLDYSVSVNTSINVSKGDGSGGFILIATYTSDSFGNFTLPMSEYNHYLMSISGQTDLHLDYFVNDMKFFMSDKTNG